MYITQIIRNISLIFISCFTINSSNSATININLVNSARNKDYNQENTIKKYNHIITYRNSNGKQTKFKFNDFDETNTEVINNIKEKFGCDFILKGLKSYPISPDGNYTLDGKKIHNVKKEFGLPMSASNLLLVLYGVSINNSNIENISIINGNKILKPIVLIYYNEINLNDNLTIKCSRIPSVKLYPTNIEKYYEIPSNCFRICKIKALESLRRYTVFQFNAPVEIDENLYTSTEKIVVKGKKVIPYDDVFWD